MVFAIFCHQLDIDHVKSNFIFCTLMIESLQVFSSENVAILLLFDTSFCRFKENKETFFGFSVKFKVVLIVFIAFCHTLDNIYAKGNFIVSSMIIKVMAIFWGKTSQ